MIVKGYFRGCKEKKERPAISADAPFYFLNLCPLSYINPAIDFWAKERTFAGKIPM